MSQENRWTVKSVASHVGLSPHVLRIWERRYKAVEPARTDTNRRYYSDDDVKRLSLLADLTRHGHAISHIAGLSSDELKTLIEAHILDVGTNQKNTVDKKMMAQVMVYLQKMDAAGLTHYLEDLCIEHGARSCAEEILSPLLNAIGCLWEDGEIRISHEHLVSEVVRDIILNLRTQFAPVVGAPVVVVATPSGHHHTLGSMMAGYILQTEGMNVINLGASLPAEEIIDACHRAKASFLALSLVFPPFDDSLLGEFDKFEKHLKMPWFIGGNFNDEFTLEIKKRKGNVLKNFQQLREYARSKAIPRRNHFVP